jgi:hypothetical protein
VHGWTYHSNTGAYALVYGNDGSPEVYVQREEPERGPANRLPVGAGPFELIFRGYQPRPEPLDGGQAP